MQQHTISTQYHEHNGNKETRLMESFNVNNLIQAGCITVSIMGGFQLWRTPHFKGIALLLGLIALASGINILEESGITRNIYLVSPIFIMLFGPATYLAALKLVKRPLPRWYLLHLLPGVIALFFTHHVQLVIGTGSIWRLIYAVFTTLVLLAYKRQLNNERSDAEEHSLSWLIWIIVLMTAFNFVDLARLNAQHLITPSLNVIGQGINNGAWLIAIMVIATKLQERQGLNLQNKEHLQPTQPEILSPISTSNANNELMHSNVEDKQHYKALFSELNQTIKANAWYRTPRLTLHELSQHCGIPPREISRAINLASEQSFNEYINGLRIQHVCNALSHSSSKPLNVIADEAGFSSKASFNKTFKNMIGETPSSFRKQQNAKQDRKGSHT